MAHIPVVTSNTRPWFQQSRGGLPVQLAQGIVEKTGHGNVFFRKRQDLAQQGVVAAVFLYSVGKTGGDPYGKLLQ